MSNVLYMAWRYLVHHRIKTSILITSITLIVFLPVGLQVLVSRSAEQLTARAEATPLIVGAKGSPLELVLNSLYFESDSPAPLVYGEVARIAGTDLARPVPLYVRFHARKNPIVGTSLDYFDFRQLRIASGRQMSMLGECVLGARVAASLGEEPGGHVVSSPESVFDLAGVYPLRMSVAGVLEPTHGPDDDAIFVDLKTAWIIEGLVHGHQDLSKPDAAAGVLRREGSNVVGNASVVQYNEITADNVDSFHFHGDRAGYPITAVITVPPDAKSSAILQGRYQSEGETCQIVRPADVMEDLLATILTVQSYVITAVVVVGLSTLATAVLVFWLSLRLRRREIETMVKIGGARFSVLAILASEIIMVLLISVGLAACLTLLSGWLGSSVIRSLIMA